MIIDQDALENLDFSLSNDYDTIANNKEDEIAIIVEKYGVVTDTNYLIASKENNYLFLINHITELYYLNKEIPEDIANTLKNNLKFKEYLLNDTKRRLNELLSNNSTLFFKEISNIVNLLSLGGKYSVFITYTHYNTEELSKLFRDHEAFLRDSESNEEHFDINFKCYNTLIEALTKLCFINSTDIQRKRTITPILDLLTETINMLKFTVTLNANRINMLNNVLGKILYYFVHIPYYEVRTKTMDYLIEEFEMNLEKQTDGFTLSLETNFGDNPEEKEQEFIHYKNNSSLLILSLIKKMERYFKEADFMNNKNFQKIVESYNKNFSALMLNNSCDTLRTFKAKLLNSLIYSYTSTFNDSPILSHKDVIDNFILDGENFKNNNLETIHNILLFSNDIEEYKYLHIADILLQSDPFKNDYYEFFKLKTVDVILTRFIETNYSENIEEFINTIYSYIEKNKIASQLISSFSKLYLSLAHYYSNKLTPQDNKKAKVFYSTFININGYELLKKEYKRINKLILEDLGRYHLQELKISNSHLTKDDFTVMGQEVAKSYLEHNELEVKYKINQEIAILSNTILKEGDLNYEKINNIISKFISQELFYGIAHVSIKGLTKESTDINDSGYQQYHIEITDKYSIHFVFPAVYEETFKCILTHNEEYIRQNITNILSGYLKNYTMYFDEITSLENIGKLKKDLVKFNETITFVEISIPSVVYVNTKFDYKTGDRYFKTIAQKIKSFTQNEDHVYKLLGTRIGIILENQDTYDKLIKKIFNFTLTLKGEAIETGFIIAVTQGTKDNILKESLRNIDEAITNKQSINIKI